MLTVDTTLQGRDARGADFTQTGFSTDMKPRPDGSYSQQQMWRLLWDLRFEPAWRKDAELENAYYDGDQLTQGILARMRDLGIAPIVVNMIAPAIDSVAGFEKITRANAKVVPETEDSFEIAQALNVKLKEATRLTNFDNKVGEQFKECLKTGVGWLEVYRNPDPFGYPYVVDLVPWREMWWDYRCRQPNLSDWRFIVRRKWYDHDVLEQYFPKHKMTIRNAMSGYSEGWLNEWEDIANNDLARDLANAVGQEARFTLEEDEWRQQARGRVALYDILYKVPQEVEVLRFREGLVVQLDRKSPLHLQAMQSGMARYEKGVTQQVRQALYIGPSRLGDQAVATNNSHYIPMVCFRRNSDGAVYGLIRRMRSPQEAVNARHSRMLYDLASRKVFVDDDAVDNHGQTAEEINKVNSYVVLRADRQGEQGIVLATATDTSPVVFQMLQEAKSNIYDVTGLHPEFQGRTLEAGRSGVAIEQLVEQTTQVLGTVIDNYQEAKRIAAERLLTLILTDIADYDNMKVEVETPSADHGAVKRTVMLNTREADGSRTNDVLMARTRVALDEAPASVTYQQQKFQALTEVIKSMPDQLQVALMDFVVRAAALPESDAILERIRGVTGFGPEPKDPQVRQQLAQQKQQAAAMQQRLQEIELMLQEAELETKTARAALDQAKAAKTEGADTDLAEAKAAGEMADIDQGEQELEIRAEEADISRVEAAGRLAAAAKAADKPDAKPAAKPAKGKK